MKALNRLGVPSSGLVAGVATIAMLAVVFSCTNTQAKQKPNYITKDAPRPGVVAKINGEEITEEQLIGEDKVEFFELEKRRFELKMDKLNKLVQDRLVGEEAKKASLSTEEFINKKVLGGEIKISDKEIEKFIKEKRIPEQQINPQIKDRIRDYLKTQKRQESLNGYMAKLTKAKPVEVYFSKPKMSVNVEIGEGTPSWGSETAKVKIIEFSDFQCPFCSKAAETVTELKKKYGKKVQIAFRHYPLPNHPEARPTSEASMCVNEQGTDKFWKFHDTAFKNQAKLSAADIEGYAKEAGANMDKFKECVTAKKYAAKVQADMEYGEKVGVRSTPSFFINGEIVAGALPIEAFSEIIDEALEAK
jgi:protein-disulfide isomerase